MAALVHFYRVIVRKVLHFKEIAIIFVSIA